MGNPSQSQDVEHNGPTVDPTADRAAKVASDSGALLQNMVSATTPSRSMFGRAADTAAAAKVGVQLLPAAWRLFKRRPLTISLIALGFVSAAYLMPRAARLREKKLV